MVRTRSREVNLDLCKVLHFPYETYLVICAQAEKAKDLGKNVFLCSSGSLSPAVARTLMPGGSGGNMRTFHQHVTGGAAAFIQHSQITPGLVNSVEKELKRIGIRDYYEINTMVTEIIGNALEHGIRDQNINWWMYHRVERGVLKLVFVDMGMGIVKSYHNAGLGRFTSDDRLVRNALDGKVGSSTKKPNRGKGLPQMDHMVRKNFISNFILITNTVTLRYTNGRYVSFRHPDFIGTYISWTVNKENFSKWQTYLTSQGNMAVL